MSTTYIERRTIRTTATGKRLVTYRYAEDFGRERGYAHSWGAREKRGTGRIWLRAGETLSEGIRRRRDEVGCE